MTLIPTVSIAGFGCPCHGGQYDTEGNRTAGPPVRALDRYSFSIRNGNLLIGQAFAVAKVEGTGAQAKIYNQTFAFPGEHVDGPESWLTRSNLPTDGGRTREGQPDPAGDHLPLDRLEERSGLIGGVKYFLFRKVPGDVNWFQSSGRRPSPRSSCRR